MSSSEKPVFRLQLNGPRAGSPVCDGDISTSDPKTSAKRKAFASASGLGRRCKDILKAKKTPKAELTTVNNGIFRFLDLPAEIRILVYESLVVKQPTGFQGFHPVLNTNHAEEVVDVCGDNFWDRPPEGDYHLWTHPILRACSKIREEGLSEFFTKNTFAFGHEFNMNLFLNVIGDFGCARIRKVSLYGLPTMWMGEQSYTPHEWRRFENYIRNIVRLENLRHLRIERNPNYFQMRNIYRFDEDAPTWIPDIETLHLDDALKSAYIGPLMQFRGLKTFEIDWRQLEVFEPKQKAWFNELEQQVKLHVLSDKPPKYHERGKFIFQGYEKESHISISQYVKFYSGEICPSKLRLAIGKPSNYFSTFAFNPEQYERDQKWRNRRDECLESFSTAWGELKYELRHRTRLRRTYRRLRICISRLHRKPSLQSLPDAQIDDPSGLTILSIPPPPPPVLLTPATAADDGILLEPPGIGITGLPSWLRNIELDVFH